MIKCLAIDDEPLALKQLSTYIGKVPYLDLVAGCCSAREASEYLQKGEIDAIFVDISMPDQSGMDFVKSLDHPPLVVFTTAYSEHALESYKVKAVDYLLKPFGLEEFQVAAAKVKEQYDLRHATDSVSEADKEGTIFFKADYKVVRVDVADIRYVEGMSEYLKIHVSGESSPVIVLLSMKKLEERLPSSMFMRIHRSYIVNLSRIREISRGRVLIDDGVSLPVGDLYKSTFQTWLDSKFMGK